MITRFAAIAFALGLFLTTSSCRHGRCYRNSDCHPDLICVDPELVVGPAKRCAKDEVRCVAGCQARCTEGSCAELGKVCGESGCCQPRPCKLNNDCPHSESCVDNKCTPPGNCTEPAVEPGTEAPPAN